MATERANIQVLVVEDNPQMAQLTTMSVERGGFSVTHVEDGESAIEYLSDHQPHLVLLDLNLPGVSGWDVMDFISKTYGSQQFPVIVTTAYGDTANRVVGKLQGVYKYLVKPFKPTELMEIVEEALQLPPSNLDGGM
jgi:DNA-binding response OmpR family regulator